LFLKLSCPEKISLTTRNLSCVSWISIHQEQILRILFLEDSISTGAIIYDATRHRILGFSYLELWKYYWIIVLSPLKRKCEKIQYWLGSSGGTLIVKIFSELIITKNSDALLPTRSLMVIYFRITSQTYVAKRHLFFAENSYLFKWNVHCIGICFLFLAKIRVKMYPGPKNIRDIQVLRGANCWSQARKFWTLRTFRFLEMATPEP
jgi:hypothetical protein